jgi:tetratricopeptide (TPR) repeat protein
VLLALAPRAAHADAKSAKPFYDRGITHYNLGHFAEAIAEFEKAYQEDPAPILLFNIAQAHRQSGNAERAIFFYRRFLEGKPDAPNKADVQKRIAELEEIVRRQNESKAQPPSQVESSDSTHAAGPPAPAMPPPTLTVDPSAQPPVVTPISAPASGIATSPQPAPASSPGKALRVAGIATASAGAASVVLGIVFSAKASSASDDVTKAKVFDPGADSSGQTAATMQWVFYGIGAAALGAGGVLYYLGMRDAAGDARVSFMPLGPSRTPGASFGMRF